MNHPLVLRRGTRLLAALVAVLVVLAGVVLAPPASAAEPEPAASAPQAAPAPLETAVSDADETAAVAAEPTADAAEPAPAADEAAPVAPETAPDVAATAEHAARTAAPRLQATGFTPELSVFAADGVTPLGDRVVRAGDTVVVKGTGYDPAGNVGGRGVPIPATLPQGTYVVFGNFATAWQPSQGAGSGARKVAVQRWALAEGVLDQVPTAYQGAVRGQWTPLAADGSFEAVLTLDGTTTVAGGTWGVYTYGAGGVNNAAQEKRVAVNYTTATLQVAVPAVARDAGASVQVTAAGLGGATGVYAAVIEKGTEASVTASGGFVAMTYVRGIDGGAFERTLTAPTASLDPARQYEVIVWQEHTMPGPATLLARADVPLSAAQWSVLHPGSVPGPAIEVSVAAVDPTTGARVAVAGRGFPGASAYAAVIEKGTEASVTSSGGYVAFGFWTDIAAGGFDKALVAETAALDRTTQYEVIVWRAHSTPDATTIQARADVPFTASHWDRLFPTAPPAPTPAPPQPAVETASPGALSWAVSSSFSRYVTGPIARGSIAVGGGATQGDGRFRFGQAAGSTFDPATGVGSVGYVGQVRFTGHGGALDVTIANPELVVTSPDAAALYVSSGGSRVHFADVALDRAARIQNGATVTFADAPVTLTEAGRASVLQGFDTRLDPLSVTIGSPSAAPAGATGTVAAAPAVARRVLPATPPATSGIELSPETLGALSAGETATVAASGFRPGERDIAVVVYSTPVLLAEVSAGPDGVARWTGALPATLEDGEHTLTFQGSVDRGVTFTLARATAASAGCVVDGAELRWGFKESFRTYIEGIAGGGWELAETTYEYPQFVWTGGTGTADLDGPAGLVAFGGSIRFTGHGGVLDTTLSGARVELAGDTGFIVFDVGGTTQSGDPVAEAGVRFAEFALPADAATGDALVLEAVPVTLTAAGAAAFGTYPAGEAMDPVDVVLPMGQGCAVASAPVAPAAESDAVAGGAETTAASAGPVVPMWAWSIGGLVLLAALAVVVIGLRRRAAARRG